MRSAPRVSVYVLHWNAAERLATTMQLLTKSSGVACDITVVDNASRPEQRQLVDQVAAGSRVVALPVNSGYAGAANTALGDFLGRAGDDEWCVLAAHDARVAPDTLSELMTAAATSNDFGVLAPVHWSKDFTRPTTIGGRWGAGGLQRARLVRASRSPHNGATGAVDVRWASGALLAVRAACARSTGGFDERLFAYWEDVDFCLRAADAGWRVGVVMGAAAAESGSTASPFAQSYFMARNHVLLARSRLGTARTWLVIAVVIGMALQAQVGASLPWRPADRRGASRAYARGRWLGVRDGIVNRGGPAPCA
ncbi:MAG TPA: glycosyltransferase family 2 protein [Acidimicrobiales bacterium]|nr:glycosyltransferase family 2 protein [Acidimicrobiales bacterium]